MFTRGEWIRRGRAQGGDMTIAAPQPRQAAGTWCDECGYSLRGLPPGSPCPECGHFSVQSEQRVSPYAAWARAVLCGLVLLLCPTLAAIGVVLIQPTNREIGGLAPALNMPGPKLWAIPLLQRPIGRQPQMPGIIGTRVAIASLIAIWLITTPSSLPTLASMQRLRCATRWGCVLLFGLAWGAMTATVEIWGDLPRYRLMLLAFVELPGTLLLYLYLRAIAARVPGLARRELFDRLVVFVPATLAAGAALLAMQVLQLGEGQQATLRIGARSALLASGMYGVAAVTCAAAATGAIGSLAAALASIAFPVSARSLHPRIARRAVDELRRWPWRRIGVASGCALIILLIIPGNEQVMWIETGPRIGGGLPYANFPGPKIWLCTLLTERVTFDGLFNYTSFIALNLLAAWLLTIRLRDDSSSNWLRSVVRWGAIISIALALAAREALDPLYLAYDNRARFGIEVYAGMMVALELPLTLLTYWLMARMALEAAQPRLARQFYGLAITMTALVSASVLAFVWSLRLTIDNEKPVMLLMAAVSGSVALASCACATRAVLSLARHVLADDAQQ
jgi:hypothetical protein